MTLGSIIHRFFSPSPSPVAQSQSKAHVYDGIGHIAIGSSPHHGVSLKVTEQINNHVRHARIGKITIKGNA
jgi:hypothetical protein